MAVAELLAEIAKPEYAGLTQAEILTQLNLVRSIFQPCPTKALSVKFLELGLQGRMQLAREQLTVTDPLWVRWLSLLAAIVDPNVPSVMFDTPPTLTGDLFDQLLSLGIVNTTEHIWLSDLGRRQFTIGRRVFARDVKDSDIMKANALAALRDKVANRRAAVQADHDARLAAIQRAHDELQKQDGELNPIGDPGFAAEWENTERARATLSYNGAVVSDGHTVTIGGRTYTYKTTLTTPNQIAIGGGAAAILTNLRAAVTAGAGVGTRYSTGTVAHADVDVVSQTTAALLLEAKLRGPAGNSIVKSTTAPNLSWDPGTTFSGGV